MGAYVTRNGKTYYKADNGKLYLNYRAAAADNSSINQVQRFAGNLWKAADKALGGFLPGGGTPNVLTRGYGPAPSAVRTVAEDVGVNPRDIKFANLSKVRPIENQVAHFLGKIGLNPWGNQGYAGNFPIRGRVIGLPENDMSPTVIAHEIGHTHSDRTGQMLPDGGRAIQAFNRTPFATPFTRGAAAAMLYFGDAKSEDAAERFTQRYAGHGQGGRVYPDGTSDYGNELRKEAFQELVEAPFTATRLPTGTSSVLASAARNVVDEAQRQYLPTLRDSLSGLLQSRIESKVGKASSNDSGFYSDSQKDAIRKFVRTDPINRGINSLRESTFKMDDWLRGTRNLLQ